MVLCLVLIILFYHNIFGIYDRITIKNEGALDKETSCQNWNNTNETEFSISSGGKSIINMLTPNQFSKTKFCDPLREKMERLIFPEGSYLNGYNMEINKDATGEVYEEYHMYIYTFRIVIPTSTLEGFRNLLQKNSFEPIRLDSKIDGKWYVSQLFGNYPKDQYTFAASYVYYIDEDSFRSVGGIFIDIIEPNGDPIIIVTAY